MEITEKQEGNAEWNDNNAQLSSTAEDDLISVLQTENLSDVENDKKIERYFQTILEPQEFEELQTLVIDSNNVISWQELIQDWVLNMENKRIQWIYWKGDLDLSWTRIKSLWKLEYVWWNLHCDHIKTLENLWNLKEVWWDLNLSWTKIKSLWKLEKVWWNLYCDYVKTLEDLWDLKEVWWYMEISRTSIKTLWWLKKVWTLTCRNQRILEDLWDLKEIKWDLYFTWTNIELQLELIKRVKKGELNIEGKIVFWWNIEKFLEQEKIQKRISWLLDIKDIDEEKLIEFINNK